jgi:DNA-directed RNA polymerase subunit F
MNELEYNTVIHCLALVTVLKHATNALEYQEEFKTILHNTEQLINQLGETQNAFVKTIVAQVQDVLPTSASEKET